MLTVTHYGDRLERGTYRVHSRFARVVNFVRAGTPGAAVPMAAVAAPEIGAGPLHLVAEGDCSRLSALTIDDGGVTVDGRAFPYARLRRTCSTVRLPRLPEPRLEANLDAAARLLAAVAPPRSLAFLLRDGAAAAAPAGAFDRAFAARARRAAAALGTPAWLEGLRLVRGAGCGFTPSGDDFAAGVLGALHVLERRYQADLGRDIGQAYATALGGNPVSNALLACCRDGFFFERARRLVQAVLGPRPGALARAVPALLGVGATSGADLATGFLLTMKARSRWLQ